MIDEDEETMRRINENLREDQAEDELRAMMDVAIVILSIACFLTVIYFFYH